VLGAQAAGQAVPNVPTPSARAAFLALVLLRVRRYLREARRVRRRVLERALTGRPFEEVERALAIEDELEAEFGAKQAARVEVELGRIAAIADPQARVAATRALLEQERRYDQARTAAAVNRVKRAAEREAVAEQSPAGAYWIWGPNPNPCPTCLFMRNRFWPWSVLAEVHPPVHPNCRCSLIGYGTAVAEGRLRPGDVLPEAEALKLARGLVIDEDEFEEAWLDATGVGALLQEALLGFGGWDPGLHPRDNLGKFIETLAELKPKGQGGIWSVNLDKFNRVSRDADGSYRLVSGGKIAQGAGGSVFKGFKMADDVALAALNRSAAQDFGGEQVGGMTKYKSFDALLKAQGIDPEDQWVGSFGDTTKPNVEAEAARLDKEAAALEAGDKFEKRAAVELRRREKNLRAKLKKWPEADEPKLPEPKPPKAEEVVPGIKVGDVVMWMTPPGEEGTYVRGVVVGKHDSPGHFKVQVTATDAPTWTEIGADLTPHMDRIEQVNFKPYEHHKPDVPEPPKKPGVPTETQYALTLQTMKTGEVLTTVDAAGSKIEVTKGLYGGYKVVKTYTDHSVSKHDDTTEDGAKQLLHQWGASLAQADVKQPGIDAPEPEPEKKPPEPDPVKKENVKALLEMMEPASGHTQQGLKLYTKDGKKVHFKRFYDGSYRAIEHKPVPGYPGKFYTGKVVKKKTANVDGLAKWAEKEGLLWKQPDMHETAPTPIAPKPAAKLSPQAVTEAVGAIPVGKVHKFETTEHGGINHPDVLVWRKSQTEFSVKAWGSGPGTSKLFSGVGASGETGAHLLTVGATTQHYEVDKKTGVPVAAAPPKPKPPPPVNPDAHWESEFLSESELEGLLNKKQSAITSDPRSSALGAYTGTSVEINRQLRETRKIGSAQTEDRIEKIEGLINDHGEFEADGLLWRGIGSQSKTAAEWKNAQEGQVIRDNGFGSASSRRSGAEKFYSAGGILLKIKWPKGGKAVWAKPVSSFGSEAEVLLQHSVSYNVIRREQRPDGGVMLVIEPRRGHK
jgi:hypothetical protein